MLGFGAGGNLAHLLRGFYVQSTEMAAEMWVDLRTRSTLALGYSHFARDGFCRWGQARVKIYQSRFGPS